MKGVTSEVIAEVRSRASILEVISEAVVLKRAGKEYKGLCPFHTEKTPSFHVNVEKGIFKCFGCGEGGDVFAFTQKIKGLDFVDTVRELAHRYGVQLTEAPEDRKAYDKRLLYLMLYQQAAQYYQRLLQSSHEGALARDYLKSRGVTAETVERFRLGYAGNSWDGLLHYLSSAHKVTPPVLVEAGLCRHKTDNDSYYDLFRQRLMIPICNNEGHVIAFGGRILGEGEIKYLNSPESPIYTKGDHLFALNLACNSIKERDAVILVEGYFDAITAHQYGFNHTVATLGTALTERQAKLLMRYTDSKKVYFCFDTDKAGVRAVDRGIETLSTVAHGTGIELRIIRIAGSKDIDEFLRSNKQDYGTQAFTRAIESAPSIIDYRLEAAISDVNISTHTGRIEAAKLLIPILAEIKDAVGRGEYIRQWSLKLALREEEVLADVGRWRRQAAFAGKDQDKASTKKSSEQQERFPKAGHVEAERQLLALYLASAEHYEQACQKLADDKFTDPIHQRIKEAAENLGKFNNNEDFQCRLMDRLAYDREAVKVLVDVILKVKELLQQNLPLDIILKEARARILQQKLEQEKNKLRLLLPLASTEEEQEHLQSRIMQLKQLETIMLPAAKTEKELSDLRCKIDALLLERHA